MSRRSKSIINAELDVLDAQLQTMGQKEEEFQKVIDSLYRMKLEAMQDRCQLQRKRLELAAEREPINWLPPELLIEVFLKFAAFDFDDACYNPPMTISHVCSKWRSLSLSTPHLWSRLIVQNSRGFEAARNYLTRSGEVPLEIGFNSVPKTFPGPECHQLASLVLMTKSYFPRVVKLSIQCNAAIPFMYITSSLKDHANKLPQLRDLTLAITTPNPSFLEAPSILNSEWAPSNVNASDSSAKVMSGSSSLWRLKLEQVPPFCLPTTLVANLRSLELDFPPGKYTDRPYYVLKMSTLGRFLSSTPLLEELILTNTVPTFDTRLPSENSTTTTTDTAALIKMLPIKLVHLKSLDWTYAGVGDVHQLLFWVEAPRLEKLDLWVERLGSISGDTNPTPTSQTHRPNVQQYQSFVQTFANHPSLRDLSLQCGEDTIGTVIRKFHMPALEKVAFTNVDTAARGSGEQISSLPTFPRLESILWDPRLLNLTHLTLSHFRISMEPGRTEAMLGYMPVLTSLHFDSCSGLGKLLDELKESVFEGVKHDGPSHQGGQVGSRLRRGVKVCPRLEALSFWGCQDVDCGTLRAVVLSRNRSTTDFAESCDVGPNGATNTVTRGVQDGNAGGGGQKTEEPQMGRKIKPLRKLRRDLGTSLQAPDTSPSTNIVSKIIAMEESFNPAKIIYLRVADCKPIERDELLSFRDLGVLDVIWAGSG